MVTCSTSLRKTFILDNIMIRLILGCQVCVLDTTIAHLRDSPESYYLTSPRYNSVSRSILHFLVLGYKHQLATKQISFTFNTCPMSTNNARSRHNTSQLLNLIEQRWKTHEAQLVGPVSRPYSVSTSSQYYQKGIVLLKMLLGLPYSISYPNIDNDLNQLQLGN